MTFPIDSSYVDGNGKQVLLSDNVRAIEAVDLLGSAFWSPGASYDGYAADGNLYTSGIVSATRATWASEPEGDHRGTLNSFPRTFFLVLTDQELSIIAADTFDLFLRFNVLELPAFLSVEMTLAVTLNGAAEVSVVVSAGTIPVGTPTVGSLTVELDSGVYRTVEYTNHNGSDTFTLHASCVDWSDPADATAGNSVTFTDVDGFFLEWIADESLPGLGRALGMEGDVLNDVTWADGRILVAGDNGTRVFDFREDRAYAFKDTGHYRFRSSSQAGLQYRDMPSYFGETVYALAGPTEGLSAVTYTSGSNVFYVVGTETGVTVFKWSANGIGSLQTRATALGGESKGQEVASDGELYVLIKYDDGGLDRLKIVRSISEWQSLGSGFSGSVHQVSLPQWPGGEGSIVLSGDLVYVAVGSGIWSTNRTSLVSPTLVYGKTLAAAEPVAPTYNILSETNDPITTALLDTTTGNLAVLYGNLLLIVSTGKHMVVGAYSTAATSIPLPTSPHALASYNFAVGGI